MADEEWARGVHPSSDWCTERTEADITEVLQLAAGRFPDDGERHHGPLQLVQRFLASTVRLCNMTWSARSLKVATPRRMRRGVWREEVRTRGQAGAQVWARELMSCCKAASVFARNDFPNYGGGDPPLIEREYWLQIPRRELQKRGMAGLDGLVILHVHYAGVWDLADDKTAFDKKRSIITQIKASYTGGKWTEAQVVLVLGSPEVPSEWSWRDPAQRDLTESTPALRHLLLKGEGCSKVVLKRFVDWVAAHSQAEAAAQAKAAAAWTAPDWASLALAAPAPAPRPAASCHSISMAPPRFPGFA